MTVEARPTRAEASDAANAVDSGVDAIMLAGETAVGKFAARAVQTLDAIIRDAEASPPADRPPCRMGGADDHAQALCEAAVTLANRGDAQAIVAVTRGGGTARRLSALRPRAPIIATTDRDDTARRLALVLGRRAGLHRHRRERRFGRDARRAAARRARAGGAGRRGRPGQHQSGSRACGRELPEDSTAVTMRS